MHFNYFDVILIVCLMLVCTSKAQSITDIYKPENQIPSDPQDLQATNGPDQGDYTKVDNPMDNPSGCQCVAFWLCSNGTVNENGENLIDIRVGAPGEEEITAEAQCPFYMDKCCSPVDGDTGGGPSTTTPKPHVYTPKCGIRHPDGQGFRITGGTHNEANYGEFPWMVAVLRRDYINDNISLKVMECGGSLIHPQVVLTGVHCVKGKEQLFIRAGEWDTQTDKEIFPIQERNVKTKIMHDEYYGGALHNDVALLVLDSPLELGDVVDTICLPEQDEIMDHRDCIVTGWGKNVFGKEGQYQVILKKLELPIVPRDECQERLRQTRLGKRFKLHKSLLCAGGIPGKDACKGDGGGPLVCPRKDNPNEYVQAGIVAWGIGCGEAHPAVYVNVPLFRMWIDDKLASLNFNN